MNKSDCVDLSIIYSKCSLYNEMYNSCKYSMENIRKYCGRRLKMHRHMVK